MESGWLIISKKTGKPVRGVSPQNSKDAVISNFKYWKGNHFYEPKDVYLKLCKKYGYIGWGSFENDPDDMTYYIKEERNIDRLFNIRCETYFVYHFDWEKFDNEIWEPYFKKNYEVKKCNYHIQLD